MVINNKCDLDKLVKWSEKWQMFNFWKCKCLHSGHGNLDVNYKTRYTVLDTNEKETALGVTIRAHMKVSEQCDIATSKGNQIPLYKLGDHIVRIL